MANNSINLVDLDPNTLKESLISYLRNQDQFNDYDFTASNMNVLLDLLSVNTFKNAFFLNMIASEAFLDSSQLRSSAISHAKELNYVPRSKRSSRARVSVTFEADGTSQPYTLPKGSSFTTLVKNDTYIFTTQEDISVSSANSTFTFEAYIYEGSYFQDSYVFDDTITNDKFRITNKDVDTNSLTVFVYEDNSNTSITYNYASTLLDLNENSRVYFVQCSENGYYEIVFGDNIIGKKPKNNSLIVLDYRVATGVNANGAKLFYTNFDPTNPNDELITTPETATLEIASNASQEETIESIRFYAPRHFQVQERAVTTSDYEIILKTKFPEINAISVYGGEEVNPPQYGKVFVAVDIANVDGLPESKKTEYIKFLKSRSPLSIEPLIVEPDFLYYRVFSHIRYNLNVTALPTETIKSLVTNAITNFNTVYLDDFNSTLRYSKFVSAIDDADASIVSNSTDVEIYKKLSPTLGTPTNYVINFGVALKDDIPEKGQKHPNKDEHTIRSSIFTFNGEKVILEDNGEGSIKITKFEGSFNTYVADAGSVDYEKGIIKLNNLKIDTYEGASFKVYAKTADKDISSSMKTILTLEPSELNITVEAVRI